MAVANLAIEEPAAKVTPRFLSLVRRTGHLGLRECRRLRVAAVHEGMDDVAGVLANWIAAMERRRASMGASA